jgi:hypothetical protein
MHSHLRDFSPAGMIMPDQVYLFMDSRKGSDYEISADRIYTIRTEQELVDSLTLEMEIFSGYGQRILDFLGTQNISANCREFTIRCIDTDDNFENLHHFYLHRLATAVEGHKTVKETYGDR